MLEYLRRNCHNCKLRHDPRCPNSYFCWDTDDKPFFVETDEVRAKRERLIERVDKIEIFLAYTIFCIIAICGLSMLLMVMSALVRSLTNA